MDKMKHILADFNYAVPKRPSVWKALLDLFEEKHSLSFMTNKT